MKKLALVTVGVAALALSACGSKNDDAVNSAELNQPAADDLNAIANDAAVNAEDSALGNSQQAPASENATAPANTTDPTDADEQNVSGM